MTPIKVKPRNYEVARFMDEKGVLHLRRVRVGTVARQQMNRRAALALHAQGKAYRWTSEAARKAGAKGLRVRYGKLSKRGKWSVIGGRKTGGRLVPKPPKRVWHDVCSSGDQDLKEG